MTHARSGHRDFEKQRLGFLDGNRLGDLVTAGMVLIQRPERIANDGSRNWTKVSDYLCFGTDKEILSVTGELASSLAGTWRWRDFSFRVY